MFVAIRVVVLNSSSQLSLLAARLAHKNGEVVGTTPPQVYLFVVRRKTFAPIDFSSHESRTTSHAN